MSDSLVRAVLSVLVPAAIFGLAAIVGIVLGRNRRLVQLDPADGRTTIAGIVPVTAVLSLLFSGLACHVLFFTDTGRDPQQTAPLWWLFCGFGVSGAFMTMMSLHRWRWDVDGLTFRGAIKSVNLPWSDIEKVGLSWGSWCARDGRRRKIYWSYEYTIGGDVITAAVAHYRPDLVENA